MIRTLIFTFLVLGISSLQLQSMINLDVVQFTQSLITTNGGENKVYKDEDECLDLLETILEEAQQIAKDTEDQKWNVILPNLLQLMKDSVDDYNCFKNSDVGISQRLVHVQNRHFRDEHLQCVIDHLKRLKDEFRDAMMALTKKEVAKFIELITKLVDDFKDIRNC